MVFFVHNLRVYIKLQMLNIHNQNIVCAPPTSNGIVGNNLSAMETPAILCLLTLLGGNLIKMYLIVD